MPSVVSSYARCFYLTSLKLPIYSTYFLISNQRAKINNNRSKYVSHVELSRFRAQNPSSGIFRSPVLSRLYHCYYCYARSPSDSLESMATLQLDVQQTSGAGDTLATSNSTAVFIWSKLSRRLLSLSPPSFSHIIISLISAEQRGKDWRAICSVEANSARQAGHQTNPASPCWKRSKTRFCNSPVESPPSNLASLLLRLLPACCKVIALNSTPAPTAIAAAVAKSAVFWLTPWGQLLP